MKNEETRGRSKWGLIGSGSYQEDEKPVGRSQDTKERKQGRVKKNS